MTGKVTQSLRKYFITGALVSLPLVVTVYVLWFAFSFLDNALGRLVSLALGRSVPGAGMVLTVLLLLSVGMFATNVVGRRLIGLGERIVLTIPLVRTIYHSVKQVIEAFSLQGNRGSFRRVVLVEYPRRGVYAVGFVTNEDVEAVEVGDGKRLLAVFVPTTPNPTSGFVLFVPRGDVIPVDMTVEQAFKGIISGGILMPDRAPDSGAVPQGGEPEQASSLR